MRINSNRGSIILLLLLAAAFLSNSCCRDNLFEPESEDFRIIAFTGEIIPDAETDEYRYQQEISWTSIDKEGIEYAVKIETTDGETPAGLFTDAEGWVYYNNEGHHYRSSDGDKKSIWQENNSFSIAFQSENEELQHIISSVQVKYRSSSEVSEPVYQDFRMNEIETRIIVPWGSVEPHVDYIATCGKGVNIQFKEIISDVFIQGFYAAYFKYRLNIVDEDTKEIISSSNWYSTMQSHDIREINLSSDTQPALTANNPGELTQIEAYVVTRGGLSEEIPKTREFRVADEFKPQAIIFTETTFVFGSNHFSTFKNPNYTIEIPNRNTPQGRIYGLPFFNDSQGRYTALLSEDMEIRFSYGWKGQYEDDNPQKAELAGHPVDANTGQTYYGEILAIDVSLNNEPLPYSFYENHPEYPERFVVTDEDRTSWLRMPVNEHVSTMPTLEAAHFVEGENILKVRVMDSQKIISETEELRFHLSPAVPRESKQNMLVIHNSVYPQPAFNNFTLDFYDDIAGELNIGRVDYIDRNQIRTEYGDLSPIPGSYLSAPELEPYKLIVWQSDNPTATGPNNANIPRELEALDIYMRGGGNMIISGGSNVHTMKKTVESGFYENRFFEDYFGLTYKDGDVTGFISAQIQTRPYFIGTYPDPNTPLDLSEIHLDTDHPYLSDLDLTGLGPVTFFNEERFADGYTEPMFRMETTEEGEEFAGKAAAIRRKTAQNATYVYGFPLSYMKQEQVVNLLNEIIADIR